VVSFVHSTRFIEFCHWSGWEDDWLRDTFISLSNVHDSVRREIGDECVLMLRALAGQRVEKTREVWN